MEARELDETQGGCRASVTLLRRNRNFRRLYLASVISLGGDWFLLIALFGLMLDLTGQAIAVAFTAPAEVPVTTGNGFTERAGSRSASALNTPT